MVSPNGDMRDKTDTHTQTLLVDSVINEMMLRACEYIETSRLESTKIKGGYEVEKRKDNDVKLG